MALGVNNGGNVDQEGKVERGRCCKVSGTFICRFCLKFTATMFICGQFVGFA